MSEHSSSPHRAASPQRHIAMNVIRAVRNLCAILVTTLALAGCQDPAREPIVDVRNHLPDLEFTLKAANARSVTQDDVKGKVALVFFGYANCPDICPTTMARLTLVTQELGEQAEQLRILFISVDPHRDTPERLEEYVRAFDNPYAMGLAGTPEQIERLARRYRVSYQIHAPASTDDTSYEVSHSRGVYVFDRNGRVRLLVTDIDAPGSMQALTQAVRSLAGEG